MPSLRWSDELDPALPTQVAEVALSGRGRAAELVDDLGLPQLAMPGQLVHRPTLPGVQV